MKGFIFIVFALFIDGLQAGLTWGLVGGLGLAGSIVPVLGNTLGVEAGIVLGFVVNFAISATFGVALITLLAMSGYGSKQLFWLLPEYIPGLNAGPGWTIVTVLCVLKKKSEQGGLVGAVAGVAVAATSPTSAISSVGGTVKKIGTGFAVLLLCTAGVAHAQTTGQPDPVQYTVAPETPGPNSPVSIEIAGVGSFLGNSTITWQKNGIVVLQGVGKNIYSFTTGGVGTKITIRVTIDSKTQGIITRMFVFYPSLVNLIWEADTSVPLLYLGKPLYSAGSRLTVTAFPTVMSGGALVPASKLSFKWFRGDTPDLTQSGLGRDSFSFVGDQLQNTEEVRVEVSVGSNHIATGEISIPASDPQVVLYNRDPLRGKLLDLALQGKTALSVKEITLQAEPYFFANASKKNGSLVWEWTLNGGEVVGPESAQGILVLRQTGSGAGAAALSVALQNNDSDKFVQAASTALQLTFGSQTGNALSNFFGL